MPSPIVRIVGGFVAGALAVLIFHQGMYVLIQQLLKMGILGAPPLGGTPWNMGPDPAAFGLPRILNQAFWGGLWGILFAFLIDRMPGGIALIKGLIFGIVFPMLLGGWIFIALIKGVPMFSGAMAKGPFNIMALRNGFLLNGLAFGIGLGLLYPLIARTMGSRT